MYIQTCICYCSSVAKSCVTLHNPMDPSSSAFPVQSVGASALPSVLLKNTQDWFPLELTGLISLLSKGTSTIFSSTTIWMHQFFGSQPSLWYNSTIWLYWPLSEKWCLHFLMHCLGLFESLTIKKKKLSAKEFMLLNCGVGEDAWESVGLWEDQTSQFSRISVLNIHWNDWCWSWNYNTLATWCKELTH